MTLLSFHFVLSNSNEYKVFNFYMEFTAYLSSQRISSLQARISLPQHYADIDSDTVLSLIFFDKICFEVLHGKRRYITNYN